MKRALSRLALLLFGVVLALAVVEGVLWLLAAFVGDVRGGARAETTILCVGDSHTYGLHVLPSDAYPARLQAELDPAANTVGVLNYGVPGRNSAVLARELPRYLRETRPDVVLIAVGYNDSWNHDGAPASTDAESTEATSRRDDGETGFDLRILRLFRLVRLQQEGRTPVPPDLIERDGELFVVEDGRTVRAALGGDAFGTLKGPALAEQVAANLRRIVALVRTSGATPVLLTYSTENQPVFTTLNASTRAVAAELDISLVALDEALAPAIAELGRRTLFFPDDHPTARGNERIAAAVATRLVELGLVERTGSRVEDAPRTPTVLRVEAEDDDGVDLVLEGAPERDFQVVLSPEEGPPLELSGVRVPLGAHPLVAKSLESQNLRGRTDARGRARCRVSRAFVAEHRGSTLHAVAAVFPKALASGASPDLSNRISFRP